MVFSHVSSPLVVTIIVMITFVNANFALEWPGSQMSSRQITPLIAMVELTDRQMIVVQLFDH